VKHAGPRPARVISFVGVHLGINCQHDFWPSTSRCRITARIIPVGRPPSARTEFTVMRQTPEGGAPLDFS